MSNQLSLLIAEKYNAYVEYLTRTSYPCESLCFPSHFEHIKVAQLVYISSDKCGTESSTVGEDSNPIMKYGVLYSMLMHLVSSSFLKCVYICHEPVTWSL